MPMQPRPTAETTRPCDPSLRVASMTGAYDIARAPTFRGTPRSGVRLRYTPNGGCAMDDALTLLHQEHEQVKQLFAQFDQAADRRAGIVEQVCGALSAHTQLEEELFYPAVQ